LQEAHLLPEQLEHKANWDHSQIFCLEGVDRQKPSWIRHCLLNGKRYFVWPERKFIKIDIIVRISQVHDKQIYQQS